MTKPTEESFRRLTLGDEVTLERLIEQSQRGMESDTSAWLTNRERAMVRIGVLVAVDAPWPLYRQEIAAAMKCGLDLDDLLAVLIAVADQVGSARVITAASHVASAAGYDIDEELDRPAVPGAET